MKKIMFYINTIKYGGAERVMVNIANNFSRLDYDVVFVTSVASDGEYVLDDSIKRINLESSNLKQSFLKKNISRIKKLREVCRREKPHILISFMPEPNFRAIIATSFLNVKNLISVRNDPDKEYPNIIYKLLCKTLYPLADGCVFQTKDAQSWFSNIVKEKSRIILNQVDEKFYNTSFNGKRKNIVTVGRLEGQKNQELLIEAFSEVAKEFSNDNLLIYGEGHLKGKMTEIIKNKKLENRVILMGTSNQIYEEIKGAKVFVLCSNYEGLPNVLMEAMALGIPVISTDCPCGGPKMLINQNYNGILIDINSKEQLVESIRKIMGDESFADLIGENAKHTAEKFKSKIIFQEWKEYIEFIINN